MHAKPNRVALVALVGFVLGGASAFAATAALLIAGAFIGGLHTIGHAAMPSALTARALLQPAALQQETAAPTLSNVNAADKRRIQEAVRTQILAYAGRDAARAFATLAPSTQQLFGKPDAFLRSVAQEMPAIFETRRFAFLGLEERRDGVVQQVLITDGMGQEWLAEFELEEHEHGHWRIKACIAQATPGQQAQSSSGSSAVRA